MDMQKKLCSNHVHLIYLSIGVSSESIALCTMSDEATSKGDKKQQSMQSLANLVADIGRHDGRINVQKPLKTNDTDTVSATR